MNYELYTYNIYQTKMKYEWDRYNYFKPMFPFYVPCFLMFSGCIEKED